MSEHVPSPRTRREFLAVLGGLGAAVLLGGCDDPADQASRRGGNKTTRTSAGGATTTVPVSTTSSCSKIPTETAGPYPGDGSNGPNVLTQNGVVRRDIRSSFGSASGVTRGVLLNIELTVVDSTNGCQPRAGAAVYLWHCDAGGLYSMYSQGATAENYLRGVQVADSAGVVRFTSTFPGAYSGRWPHIHFQVFSNSTTNSSTRLTTSQLALPADICRTVYGTSGYPQSLTNLTQTPIERDNVFSDGFSLQMATVTGDTSSGYTARLQVAA